MTKEQLAATPLGFASIYLGLTPYDWQARALTALERCGPGSLVRMAICTPNGAGKSAVILPGMVLWWLAVHPRGRVVATTKDGRQLDQQLCRALEAHREKFPEWKWTRRHIETPTGGFFTGFTTDDAGRAEGWHKLNDIDGPLLMIADESKSIDEEIFQAIDRCTYNALVLTSSPGAKMGRFYQCFSAARDKWTTIKAGLKDCPHKSQEKIDALLADYPPDHPFIRSTLHGEFMDDDGQQFIFPLSIVDAAFMSPPKERYMEGRTAFCDFAGGGDENVLALRTNNKVEIVKAWRERNEMAAVGEFIREFRRLNLRPEETFGDSCGAGKVMCARFDELGWQINRVNAGADAQRKDLYRNKGAELWHETARALREGRLILPDDEKLKAQLVTRYSRTSSDGRLWMEPKEDMAKRGLKSPDRADAVCGAWACGMAAPVTPGKLGALSQPTQQWDQIEENEDFYSGFNAGRY